MENIIKYGKYTIVHEKEKTIILMDGE